MGPEVEISNFGKSKMADGRHIKKLKNRHISAAFSAILPKFGTQTQFDPLERRNRQKFEIFKIQDGGYISGKVRPIFTKFGKVMHIGPPNGTGS